MVSWETLGHGLHVDVSLIRNTQLNIFGDQNNLSGQHQLQCHPMFSNYKHIKSVEPSDIKQALLMVWLITVCMYLDDILYLSH